METPNIRKCIELVKFNGLCGNWLKAEDELKQLSKPETTTGEVKECEHRGVELYQGREVTVCYKA